MSSTNIEKFERYSREATFFINLLEDDFNNLDKGMKVIDVGCGIGLLAFFAADKGLRVHAIEPGSAGFAAMEALRNEVVRKRLMAKSSFQPPQFEKIPLETFAANNKNEKFDFGYSTNVVQHVGNLSAHVSAISAILESGGYFRLVCPNYLFPYEPHFNHVTFFSKNLTWKVWGKKFSATEKIDDPIGFWEDLTWPTPNKISKAARKAGMTVMFSRSASVAYVERLTEDSGFRERKGSVFVAVASAFLPILRLYVQFGPRALLPVIDVRLQRTGKR